MVELAHVLDDGEVELSRLDHAPGQTASTARRARSAPPAKPPDVLQCPLRHKTAIRAPTSSGSSGSGSRATGVDDAWVARGPSSTMGCLRCAYSWVSSLAPPGLVAHPGPNTEHWIGPRKAPLLPLVVLPGSPRRGQALNHLHHLAHARHRRALHGPRRRLLPQTRPRTHRQTTHRPTGEPRPEGHPRRAATQDA